MKVTLDIPALLLFYFFDLKPVGEDEAEVIGDSRLLYLDKRLGRSHPLESAARWHDKCYLESWSGRMEGWSRWRVDIHFLLLMLAKCEYDEELLKEVLILFLAVRKYGDAWWNKEGYEGNGV